MTYVISDIHGCYKQYIELLEKINFHDKDVLYVLGDAIDRGPEPIKVIQDIIKRKNVFFILGNHELLMYRVIKPIISSNKRKKKLSKEAKLEYEEWLSDGGLITENYFWGLAEEEQHEILDFIESSPEAIEVECDGEKYFLTHGDKKNWDVNNSSIYTIIGHTPTFFINGTGRAEVFIKDRIIAIDCGCSYRGKLAAFCLETKEVTYVK